MRPESARSAHMGELLASGLDVREHEDSARLAQEGGMFLLGGCSTIIGSDRAPSDLPCGTRLAASLQCAPACSPLTCGILRSRAGGGPGFRESP